MLFALLVASITPACIPCDDDAVITVFKRGLVSLPANLPSRAESGFVRVAVSRPWNEYETEVLEVSPKDLPTAIVERMIEETVFATTARPKHAFCSEEVFELTLEFPMPTLPAMERELSFSIPKLNLSAPSH